MKNPKELNPVTADAFFSAWTKCADQEPFNSNWENYYGGSDRKAYTHLVIHNEDSLIKKVAKELKLECYNDDYRKIDAIFYKPQDKMVMPSNEKVYFYNTIRIAFEHEQDTVSDKLIEEMSHLLTINCELRVLVSYYDPAHTTEESRKVELDSLHKMISGCQDSPRISKEESFLFILGHHQNNNNIAKLVYQGFIYKRKPDIWDPIK